MSNDTRLALPKFRGPLDDLQQKLLSSDGDDWLAALKRFLRKENPWAEISPEIDLTLDCSEPLEPVDFIGRNWSVWRGPADGDGLEGEEEQDKRSLALMQVNFGAVRFETCLQADESCIQGEAKLLRLQEKAGIRPAGNIVLALWKDYTTRKKSSVLEWFWRSRRVKYLDFFGVVLRSGGFGRRTVLCFHRDKDGRWSKGCNSLHNDRDDGTLSLLLEIECTKLEI